MPWLSAAAQFAEDTTLGGPPFDFEDAKFHLHTVTIKAALVLPTSGTADIMINLRPTDASAASNRFEFKICSVADERWIEHAQGIVSFELVQGEKTQKVPFNNETEVPVFEQTFGKDAWYERLKYRGFDFGPLFFALLTRLRSSLMRRVLAREPLFSRQLRRPHHSSLGMQSTSTIDAVLQGRVASVYSSRADKEAATQIPVFIEEMSISPSSWAKNQTGIIDSVAWTEGARSGESRLNADYGERL